MKYRRRKPKRSLRTILILWFLFFSIAPLAFVSVYSMKKFEKAIDNELSQRLSAYARDIQTVLSDYRSGMIQRREKYAKDESLLYYLSTNDSRSLKELATVYLQSDFTTQLSFFDKDSQLMFSLFKDQKGRIQEFVPVNERLLLSDKYLFHLKEHNEIGAADLKDNQKISLKLYSKFKSSSGRTIGYFEQVIDLDKIFVDRLKSRLKLEVVFFKDSGTVSLASNSEFYREKTEILRHVLTRSSEMFFETNLDTEPYGFLIKPIIWDSSQFYTAVGVSKKESKDVIQKINVAFLSVVGIAGIVLFITIFISSSYVLKPLNDLVEALQSFESQEQAITIPVNNHTEIGLLTESFNNMSLKITQAKNDLRKKIKELEKANLELKETQSKLVHSAKMISLGQLVAGVAHELNNPIGFIYSNMSHLKEYSEKLLQLVKTAGEHPEKLKDLSDQYELSYIEQDLPKLIQSCEDGARRTRDIVVGLRNFSRLEKANLKEVDIHECIDATLELLSGEIKNKVQIHKQFEKVPNILCFVTQINQVLMNLLSNAVQAVKTEGQIWIATQAVKRGSKKPESDQVFKADGVLLTIQDNGSGISEKNLEKIFDPFFTTKDVGQGTGLGLSISYGIIQEHGGDIYVKSEVGVGTEFVVYLPLKPPQS